MSDEGIARDELIVHRFNERLARASSVDAWMGASLAPTRRSHLISIDDSRLVTVRIHPICQGSGRF